MVKFKIIADFRGGEVGAYIRGGLFLGFYGMRKSIYTNTHIQRRSLQSKEISMNERKRRFGRNTAVSF